VLLRITHPGIAASLRCRLRRSVPELTFALLSLPQAALDFGSICGTLCEMNLRFAASATGGAQFRFHRQRSNTIPLSISFSGLPAGENKNIDARMR